MGFTIQTLSNQVPLGRTMNYDYPLDGSSTMTLRNYYWKSRTGMTDQTQYDFIGTGTDVGGFIYGNGVNERDVAISAQYFRGYSSYGSTHKADTMNITQNEIMTWILGYTISIEDTKQQASQIHVVAVYLNDIDEVPPLYYHVSGATGHTVEVSFKEGEMVIEDNPIGVLTNHPDLNWHYSSLRQYISISPYPATTNLLEGVTIRPLGNEAGTFGLPGGFTSTECFVRMAFIKANITQSNDKEVNPINALYLLNAVNTLIGIVCPHNADSHYTVYRTAINLTARTLYIKYYGSNELVALKSTDDLINRKGMTIFKPERHITIRKLNDNQ